MQDSRAHTFLIIVAVIGTVCAIGASITYWWLFLKVQSAVSEVGFVSEEVQLLAVKNAHTQTIRRVVRDTRDIRAQLESYFVHENDIVTFLEEVEALNEYTGATIDIESVQVGKAIDKDGLALPLNLNIKSTGELQEVFHTLTLLETFPKALRVEHVRLVQDPDTLVWEGDFTIVVIQSSTFENI